MSIPPLVCSTPPPPDQCEDDKENEDFDLRYNLSQEDDDDEDSTEYNYGNYSGYNIYPPKTEKIAKENWSSTFSELTDVKPKDETSEEIISVNLIPDDHLFSENASKFEENVLEDLNLQINSINVHSNDISTKEYETENNVYSNESSDKNSMIQDQGGTDIIENVEETIDRVDTSSFTKVGDSSISNTANKRDIENDEILKNTVVSTEDISEIMLDNRIRSKKTEEVVLSDKINLKNDSEFIENVDQTQDKSLSDDEFGDFEDFQCTISSNTQVIAVNSENPWDNNISGSPQFGDFKANFDNTKSNEVSNNVTNIGKDSRTVDGEDDFGDFDDFKSSTLNAETKTDIKDLELTLTSNVSVLNLQSPENELQIVDSINNVLTSIFTEEISEPVNDLEGKLELFLSETWGHLIDIDVRQPYIINWNNSLAQKTLLKALCIDSRNILFGPKWNYSTPKYATNLSTAPLQPQKQQQHVQPNMSSTDSTEKVFNKEVPTWSDPFTHDGQESCSTEKESDKTETIIKPTDLDVFGTDNSTKSIKIYSNTINVQPLRHINLPDTHIFTPTDSETPRSKTIHYDSALPKLTPKPVSETVINQPEVKVSESSNKSESEYWEFQDFKGTVTEVSANNQAIDVESPKQVDSLPDNSNKTFATYQTQILQPIKIEPIMPTLNWPDPGEVKETFDDFSEFVSSSSWNNEKDNINCETDVQVVNPKPKDHNEEFSSRTGNMEDEFETFQSAPVLNPTVDIVSSFISSPQSTITDTFAMTINENSDNTSFKKEDKLIAGSNLLCIENKSNFSSLQHGIGPKSSTSNPINPHINNNILLPENLNTGALTTVRNHNNTGQILQPLSLESYSQINWPNPGIDLQDLSKFNPINSLHSLKSETNTSNSKVGSPIHNSVHNDVADDDIWGEFVSNVPKIQQTSPKKHTDADDDEWTDFVSSPSIKPQNGLNTISLNVHTNSSMHKVANQNKFASGSKIHLDIPALNYITPKSNNRGIYMEKHFQNL